MPKKIYIRSFFFQKIFLILALFIFCSSVIDLSSKCDVKNKSKYLGKDEQFGEMIFDTSLPFGEENKFKGIAKTFTWGEFDHLEGRAYFPCKFVDIKNRLLNEVVQKGIFTNPYINS
ncbi:MAG: hypothetical protein N2319_10570 [Candidatus Kapabacteria bacterium]|nr:hypothetical protein [Candidatus Kapabacteria bacterium]